MRKQLLFLLFLGSLPFQTAFAQYGVPDLSFGTNGRTKIDFGNTGFSICQAMAVDPNGFIFMVGNSADGGFAIAKLSSDGQLVNSFGNNGYLHVPITDYIAVATSIALDAAGRLIVAGYVYNATDTDAAVIMLDTDGNLVSSFGTGGKLVLSLNAGEDRAHAIELDAYGNIYLGGYATIGVLKSFAIAKLSATGNLVSSFGTGGKAFYTLLNGDNAAYDLLIDGDTLYACGYTTNLTTFAEDFAVIKTTLNGELIPAFGSSGKQTFSIGVKEERAFAIAKDPWDHFVIAGYTYNAWTYDDFAAVKFDWKGNLVTPFGMKQIGMSSSSMANDRARAISIDATGNITLAGYADWNYNRMAVLRLDKDGNAMAAFNSGGKKTQDIDLRHDYGYALAVDASGHFLVAGSANNDNYDQFAVISLDATGTLVPAFGTAGITKFSLAKSNEAIGKMLADGSNNIVLCGTAYKDKQYYLALSKLDANGQVLTSFGTNGKVLVPQLATADNWSSGTAMSLDQSANIYVGGLTYETASSKYKPCVMKFNSNGNAVTSFGSSGKRVVTVPTDLQSVFDLLVDQAGYIYMIGTVHNGSNTDFVVLKLDASGTLVSSFGNGGQLIIPVGTGNDAPKSGTLDGLGNLYLTGSAVVGSNNQFAVVKITTGGALVSTFGSNGKLILTVGTSASVAVGTVPDASGNLIIGGHYVFGSSYDFALIKTDVNGNLINSFGSNGKFTTPVGNRLDQSFSLSLDPSGNILLSGTLFDTYGSLWGIISVNPAGALNTTFGDNGKVILPYGYCYTQLVTASGDIVLAGSDTRDFSVLKLTGLPSLPTASQDKQSDPLQLIVYPNPSSGTLQIHSDYSLNKIVLTDAYGQTEEHPGTPLLTQMKGLVLVTVYTTQGHTTRKVVLE